VLAAIHDLISPNDFTQDVSGKLRHEPYKIIKETDRATPLLYKALVNNEVLSEFKLDFFRQTGNVVIVQNVYSVKLINARITGIRFEMPHTKKADTLSLNEYEEISFVYDSIEWTWHVGNVSYTANV
jgi:type VI secretion system secreted protein Hcp